MTYKMNELPKAKFVVKTMTIRGWRKLKDCKFFDRERAEAYGQKYWTTKDGAKLYKVFEEK